jgi:hypothetical protein
MELSNRPPQRYSLPRVNEADDLDDMALRSKAAAAISRSPQVIVSAAEWRNGAPLRAKNANICVVEISL